MVFPEFSDQQTYLNFLKDHSTIPDGFSVSTTRIAFTPAERPSLEPYRMDLSLVLMDAPTRRFGAVFTRNAFPGAPVILGKQRMSGELQGLLVNNKIANVRARTGIEDAQRLTSTLGSVASIPGESVLSVSTGIIGWALPVPEMEAAIPGLCSSLHKGSALDVAQSIMTTDSYPKIRKIEVSGGTILGIAKGAGMIEPNMATMLVFLLTDLAVDRETIRRCLADSVDRTFNAISVDGDMSTSDMAVLMSSGVRPAPQESEFSSALTELCGQLARDVVRNGEGTSHVIEVTVSGLPDNRSARAAGKAIVNSPLVKTAMYGNDPNVGRLLSALGDFLGNQGMEIDPATVEISMGAETVFSRGAFELDREKEIRLADYLKRTALNPRVTGYPQHQRTVEITISCGDAPGCATVWGSDLSDQYVHENADYRT
jgi:glutamate N-acetyltransferase/amino-acid N-acetyltransferase